MKKVLFNILICSLISLLFLTSCENDWLDKPASEGMTSDTVFSTIENAEKVLNTAYGLMPYGFPTISGGAWNYGISINRTMPSSLSDESEDIETSSMVHAYHNDAISAMTIFPYLEDKWAYNFAAIRYAWMFFENVDKTMEAKTNPQYIKELKGQALGIIGIKYFELFKRYGGMVWVNKYYTTEVVDLPRLTIEETVDSIAGILDRAMALLPDKYTGKDFGRISKTALMGVKSRLFLYAASPLFNSETPYMNYGKPLFICYGNYDINRWKKAADAAKALIDYSEQNGLYSLYDTDQPEKDYFASTTDISATNTETILGTRIQGTFDIQGWERLKIFSRTNALKPGYGNRATGKPTACPTQNFVDLYETINGLSQAEDPAFNPQDPYNKAVLDPRFFATVVCQDSKWDIYDVDFSFTPATNKYGDNNPTGMGAYTAIGYSLRKFLQPEIDRLGKPAPNYWPYMRLAEIYLNYAEALNEYSPGHPDILKYLNKIRERAGIAQLPVKPSDETQEGIRSRIQNERAIELAFEAHRYFDLKRWKRGSVLGGEMYGMSITKTGSVYTYEKTRFETRIFTNRMYLYPFPNAETQKSTYLIQNPGW
jgi:starch-binding outer membrane protein, SusD/RagB family